MRVFLSCLLLALAVPLARAQDSLEIYLIDVEGGGATLIVAPSGASMLVDTGNGGAAAGRDSGRILAAAEDAGLERIDYLLTTHWHGDHYGSMETLVSQIAVGTFLDHGPSVEAGRGGAPTFAESTYPNLYGNAARRVVVPGDRVELGPEAAFTFLASAGEVLETSLPGRGEPNGYCAGFTPQAEDTGENARSAGGLLSFGDFDALHLGDLTVNVEYRLMCPENPVGAVDLFVVSHHGQPSSNDPVLVHAARPRVAVMNNGIRKGGQPEAMEVLFTSPGLEDLWQLHASQLGGQEHTVPGIFIANRTDEAEGAMPLEPRTGRGGGPAPPHDGPAAWIRISAGRDGSFTVTNSRNGFSKGYPAR